MIPNRNDVPLISAQNQKVGEANQPGDVKVSVKTINNAISSNFHSFSGFARQIANL